MKSFYLRIVAVIILLNGLNTGLAAQGFSFHCTRDTALPGCPPNLCFTLKALIPNPHRQSNNYAVNATGAMPTCLLASSNPGIPGAPTNLNLDDRYSSPFAIGFPFIFFGTPYSNLVVSSNGYLSFNTALTGFSHYGILNSGGGLSASTGTPQDLPSTLYDEAIIMGPYHDIDIGVTTSPSRLISYSTQGLAPYRRWILNYFKIPLFSSACNSLFENTHQIILYESTGIIDVNIFDKQICAGWNQGRAMVGVQNFAQNVGVMAPGRKASDPPWGSIGMNESWRFIPIGGTPLFRRVELYDMSGNLVTTGTSVDLGNGDREASFPNICPPAGTTTRYVVKAFYDKIDDPTQEIFALDTIGVDRAQSLAATPTTISATCGALNGSITVSNVSGGTSPYEYSLDGITWQSSNVFSGLAAGTYTVHVRDFSGTCNSTYTVTVGLVGNLSAVTTNTPAACAGVNNGSITITSSTGTAPFSFSLDGTAFVAGALPYTFSNLTPGSHTVVVKDVNNCLTNTITITVATGTGVTATSTATSTSCSGVNDATITVTASTGTAPFMYQLGAGPFQASNVFTGLAPGTYTITVRDNVGCTRTLTRTVFAGTGLTATVAQAATSCSGANDGTVTVTPTNGTSPYQFSIDGGASVSAPASYTFTNLAPGSHTVFITDTRGCTRTSTITVGTGAVLAATAAPASTSCSGASDGTITVTPTNGTGPFEFSLDGGTYVAGTAPYTFTGLSSGTHTITIRNAAGCVSNVINTSVTAGPVITTTASKTDVLCNGGNTGTITVAQPAVGATPFEYSLDGTTWQTSNVFNGLAAGTYTVYYRSANGCQNSLSIIVDQPTTLTSGNSVIPVVCNGLSNGTITITSVGGVSPHQYSIDGTNWQGSNVFNVPAGTYTITTRDVNGCTNQQVITVTEPATLAATSANSNASCDGGNDGVITVNAVGGNTSYQYSIDGGTTWQNSNVFNVAPGNYTVMVKDNLGCSAQFNTTVGLTNNLTYTRQTDPVICESKSVQLDFISNATQYAWTPATALSSTTIHNPVANPVVTTEYRVLATLGRCNVEDTVIVNVNLAPIPNAGTDGFICYGQSYQLNAINGVQYKWTPSTYLDNPNIANPLSTPTKDIVYTLSIISDVNGCASLTTDDIAIDVTPPIKIKTYPADTVVYQSDVLQISAVPFDPDVIYFNWSPSLGLDNPAIANPTVTAGQIGEDIMYQVIGSTVAGCKGEAYVRVRVYKGPDIYVPTGFTPNGDGLNDKLIPFPVGIKQLNYFRVFNRWGQQIFSTSKLHDGWDGTINGTRQASGTYVWMAEAVTEQDKVITKKGVLTLIR